MKARNQLPSVKALQAFEAAARRLSFSQAAVELNVTSAAISQQIRGLELQLGVKLFARPGRGVRLSETGKAWLPEVRRCLECIKYTAEFANQHSSKVLSITVAPSVASRWLMGRLHRFSEKHPEISVRVIATPEVVDLHQQDVDLAIRFGPGGYQGLLVERFLPEFLVPMCAPALLNNGPPLDQPDDLANHTLIHDDSVTIAGGGWPLWLHAANAIQVDATRGPRYSLADIALQEAIDGRGVVLGRWQLAAQDIRAGRLVCPIDLSIESPYAYYFVTQHELMQTAKVVTLREWLFQEAATIERPDVAVV